MGRFAFVVRRLILLVPLLVGIVFVVFLLLKITPGNPARAALGFRASPAAVAAAAKEMGLTKSVPEQFITYLGHVLHGDLGYSFKSRSSVAATLASEAPITLWLIAAGVALSLVIAIPLAVIAAVRRDGLVDHFVRGFCVISISMPMFWIGIMLITLIALPTGVFPVGGYGSTIGQHVRALALPGLTLGIAMAPVMIRGLRATIIEVLESDYVAAGRSLGLSGYRLQRRFVLRNALPPLVTLLALEAGYFLFGAVVIETTFGLPGLGQGLVVATQNRDFPLVQGYTLVFAAAVVAIYLLADIAIALLDPRVAIKA